MYVFDASQAEVQELPTGDEAASIKASTAVVEPLGDRTHVHVVTSAGDRIVACVSPAASIIPEQEVNLAVDVSCCHFFSPDGTGERLA